MAVTVTVLAALAGLAGCGGGTAASITAPQAVPTTTSAPGTPANSGVSEVAKKAFVDALNAVDKDIVGDKAPDTIISRGRNQCASIKESPDDRAKLLDLTRQRFTAPGHPDGFPPTTVEKILDAVKAHLCS